MTRRSLVIVLLIGLIGALGLAACGGGDDNATNTPTATAAHTTAASSKTATGTAKATAAATTSAATSTSSSGSGVYDVSNGKVPFEVCDVFTGQIVADALGESASNFENNSLGKQIPPTPFVTGEQCEWIDFSSGLGASVNTSFTATADDAKAQLDKDCDGQESVDVGGDGGCYPQYTGQLRAVKGNVYMVFMLSGDIGGNNKGIEKTLAEQMISGLP